METQQGTGTHDDRAERVSRPRGQEPRPGERGGRRRRVVVAALQVIGREGIARFTLRQVAGDAHVDLAGVYRLFPTKEALMLAALEEVTSVIIAAVTTAADPRAGLRATLVATIDALWALGEQPPHHLQVRCELVLHARHAPPSLLLRAAQRRRLVGELAALLQDACDVTGDRSAVPVAALADLLMCGADGFANQGVPADAERVRARDVLLRATLALAEGTMDPGSPVRQVEG